MPRRPWSDRSREGAVGSEETIMVDSNQPSVSCRDPWNKGRLMGQKCPLKPRDVWSIRVRLQVEHRARNLALFNLSIDSKLRGCDLVRLQVDDVSVGGRVRDRATIVQKKTGRPVQFEITEQTQAAIQAWLADIRSRSTGYLFPSRVRTQPHLSTRQYARIVHSWVASAGLDSSAYGTHSMRRTKAAQIHKKTGNLRAVQLLLGHTKLESTVRYLRIVREVRLCPEAAREKVAPIPEFGFRQPVLDRGPSLRGNFELHRSPRFLLDYGAAVADLHARPYVMDLQAEEIAAPELAVNRKVEQGKVAFGALELEPDPNCPDVFRLERALLAGQATLVPRSLPGRRWRGDRGVHGCLLDPDRAAPSARRWGGKSIYP